MQHSTLLKEPRVHVHAKDSNSCPPEKEFDALTKWLAGRVSCLSFSRLSTEVPPAPAICWVTMLVRSSMLKRAQSSCQLRGFTVMLSRKGVWRPDQMASWPGTLSEPQQQASPPSTSNCCSTVLYEKLKAELHCRVVEGEWNPHPTPLPPYQLVLGYS